MPDHRDTVDELAGLIEEFKLDRASLQVGEFKIAFEKRRKVAKVEAPAAGFEEASEDAEAPDHLAPAAPAGMPVTSPMTGIYYGSPSPGASAFVTIGEMVTAGQVVGLIEAMKVFNEITSPFSGTVDRVVVESGAVVQSGDVLMYLV